VPATFQQAASKGLDAPKPVEYGVAMTVQLLGCPGGGPLAAEPGLEGLQQDVAFLRPPWAVNGPFASFHLGGGGGLTEFFEKFGAEVDAAWKVQSAVDLDAAAQQRIVAQAASTFGKVPGARAERARDAGQLAVLSALRARRGSDQAAAT